MRRSYSSNESKRQGALSASDPDCIARTPHNSRDIGIDLKSARNPCRLAQSHDLARELLLDRPISLNGSPPPPYASGSTFLYPLSLSLSLSLTSLLDRLLFLLGGLCSSITTTSSSSLSTLLGGGPLENSLLSIDSLTISGGGAIGGGGIGGGTTLTLSIDTSLSPRLISTVSDTPLVLLRDRRERFRDGGASGKTSLVTVCWAMTGPCWPGMQLYRSQRMSRKPATEPRTMPITVPEAGPESMSP